MKDVCADPSKACSHAHCECVLSFQTHSLLLTQDQLDLLSFYVVRTEAAAADQYPTIVLTDYWALLLETCFRTGC